MSQPSAGVDFVLRQGTSSQGCGLEEGGQEGKVVIVQAELLE